jgi:hypothetical protein
MKTELYTTRLGTIPTELLLKNLTNANSPGGIVGIEDEIRLAFPAGFAVTVQIERQMPDPKNQQDVEATIENPGAVLQRKIVGLVLEPNEQRRRTPLVA